MSVIIHAENLTRTFGKMPGVLTAVDHLNLEVQQGEIFCLVGPDGAGKTTTMRLLCGLMNPTEGRAIVAGQDVAKNVDVVKDQIGYMAQRFGLYADLTVAENMDFYADLFGILGQERKELTGRLMRMTRMGPFTARQAGKLSGGMKQKLALMCTLLHKPRILFLDEPTNGVDPVSRRDFWRILYQLLRERVTIFVSTAYLDEAERCNRVALIHEGKVLTVGTPREVKKLMRGSILELRLAEPRKATAVLRREMPDATVGLFGDRVHLVSNNPHAAQVQAEQILERAGLHVQAVRPIEPGLEDVFVSVLGPEAGADKES